MSAEIYWKLSQSERTWFGAGEGLLSSMRSYVTRQGKAGRLRQASSRACRPFTGVITPVVSDVV